MACSKYSKWFKPLKRSQKSRLRKELEKRKKEEKCNLDLDGDKWVCSFYD